MSRASGGERGEQGERGRAGRAGRAGASGGVQGERGRVGACRASGSVRRWMEIDVLHHSRRPTLIAKEYTDDTT